MNILVLGGGGREHAIAWSLAKSPRTDKLYVAPGNGGTADIARNVGDLAVEDGRAVLAFVEEHDVELVVIGPEAPRCGRGRRAARGRHRRVRPRRPGRPARGQ